MPMHRDQQASRTSPPQAIIKLGSMLLSLSARLTMIRSLTQEDPRKLFGALVSMGPKLKTAQQNDMEQGSPRQAIGQECAVRRGFDYPSIPYQEELQNGEGHHSQKSPEAHSTGQGGVEYVHIVTQHSRALKCECPASNHCY